jgi:hypothetical protein
LVFEAFPEVRRFDKRADVLAFDWNGKQYLTARPSLSKKVVVLVADLGTGSVGELATADEFAAARRAGHQGCQRFSEWMPATLWSIARPIFFFDQRQLVDPYTHILANREMSPKAQPT